MEFEDDDHEQEEEEEEEEDDDDDEGTTIPPSAPSAAATTSLAVPHTSTGASRYRECQKNHAVSIGGHAVDGCGEFMPAGEDGTLNALKCAACGCHRNFHRKETDSSSAAPSPELAGADASSSAAAAAAAAAALYQPQYPHHPAYYRATPALPPPGYLQHPHRPLALPSTTPEMEELSNPSSSGGGKKRFRTKFTAEQKERMVEFAERIGWRITKQDEAAVEQFCSELRLSRQVLKVWLHNNKHTLGRKP